MVAVAPHYWNSPSAARDIRGMPLLELMMAAFLGVIEFCVETPEESSYSRDCKTPQEAWHKAPGMMRLSASCKPELAETRTNKDHKPFRELTNQLAPFIPSLRCHEWCQYSNTRIAF
jgi:hypothetical protein